MTPWYHKPINRKEGMHKMTKEDKKITASVSHECWKALKVLAVQKEVSLQVVVREVLERMMLKRVKSNIAAELQTEE
jgi:predicted DNA binding CopG/RHH family protein